MEYGVLNHITFVFQFLFFSALLFLITGQYIGLSLNPFFLKAPNLHWFKECLKILSVLVIIYRIEYFFYFIIQLS